MRQSEIPVHKWLIAKACGYIAAAIGTIQALSKRNMTRESSVYKMNYPVSGAVSILSFAADLYAIPAVLRSKAAITNEELLTINPGAVAAFNRPALLLDYRRKDYYKKISDHLLRAAVALAGILFLDRRMRGDAAELLMLYAETHAITYTLYSFSPVGPAFQDKYRPVVYYTRLPDGERNPGNNRNSMYSGHTGNAACAAFFIAKVFQDYNPELNSGRKLTLYALACVPPLLVGFFRVRALKHFPSDVLVGALIGAACGVAVPALHKMEGSFVKE